MLNNKTILVTGGTGSFGHHFVDYVFKHYSPKKVIIYSRDEFKQFIMENDYKAHRDKLRFFIGDVRDESRLCMAMHGVDYVIHAAALKQVPACEYNPNEAIKTNVNGAMNVISSALAANVKKVVALSTDKAVNTWVTLKGDLKLECWNPHTGAIEKWENVEYLKDKQGETYTKINLQLAPVSSIFAVSQ